MRLTWKLALNLITVVVLGVVMVGWVVTQLIGSSGLVNKPFEVTADFAASGGVFSNQEVTYRGVLVGKVGSMSLGDDNDGVDIQLLIDPEWEDRIPAEVVAEVQSKSAVGEQFVNLTPVDGAGPEMLADGDLIPRKSTKLPVDFQALLTSLDKVLADIPPDQTSRVIRNLSSGLRGREEDIKTILSSLSILSDTFVDSATEQTRLLDNSTATGEAFLDSKDDLAAAIKAADDVFEGLGDEPGELKRFFDANDRVAREGIRLLRRQSGNYLRGIRALADLTEFQLREQELIAQSFDHVPGFLHAIEDASVPWESPDGKKYYRIRGGLVLDNVPESWPCPYRNPFEYERLPHERRERPTDKDMDCANITSSDAAKELAAALQAWADADPELIAQQALWEEFGAPSIPTDGFMWPLDGAVTSPFGPRWGRMHTGIDIDGVTGEPIVASASGKVTLASVYSGYGNAVIVEHGNGMATLYAHMSRIGVSVGDTVVQGQYLGDVGCTGHCFGDHLHFEIRINGTPVDPLPYLTGAYNIFGDVVTETDEPPVDVVEVGEDEAEEKPSPQPVESPDEQDEKGETAPPAKEPDRVAAPDSGQIAAPREGWSDLSGSGAEQDDLPVTYE